MQTDPAYKWFQGQYLPLRVMYLARPVLSSAIRLWVWSECDNILPEWNKVDLEISLLKYDCLVSPKDYTVYEKLVRFGTTVLCLTIMMNSIFPDSSCLPFFKRRRQLSSLTYDWSVRGVATVLFTPVYGNFVDNKQKYLSANAMLHTIALST